MPRPRDLTANRWAQDYADAVDCFKDEQYFEAITLAKSNVLHDGIPLYWTIKNRILIVNAEDSWPNAERYRLFAQEEWSQLNDLTETSNEVGQACLRELREDLDELAESQLGEVERQARGDFSGLDKLNEFDVLDDSAELDDFGDLENSDELDNPNEVDAPEELDDSKEPDGFDEPDEFEGLDDFEGVDDTRSHQESREDGEDTRATQSSPAETELTGSGKAGKAVFTSAKSLARLLELSQEDSTAEKTLSPERSGHPPVETRKRSMKKKTMSLPVRPRITASTYQPPEHKATPTPSFDPDHATEIVPLPPKSKHFGGERSHG